MTQIGVRFSLIHDVIMKLLHDSHENHDVTKKLLCAGFIKFLQISQDKKENADKKVCKEYIFKYSPLIHTETSLSNVLDDLKNMLLMFLMPA